MLHFPPAHSRSSTSPAPRVAFVTPPPVKPSEPGLSAGAATSVLLQGGVDAHWVDGSIGWHRFVLDPRRLSTALDCASVRGLAAKDMLAMRRAAESLRASPPLLARRETYENRHVYSSAVNDLENGLRLVAAAHPGFRLGVAMLALDNPPRRLESSATLAWLASAQGPFDAYFLEELIPWIQEHRVQVLAVSLTFQQQAPAALRLAQLLVEHAPEVRRVLGGPLVACWTAAGISLDREPWTLFHSVVPGTSKDLLALVSDLEGTPRGPIPTSAIEPLGPLSVPLHQGRWDDYMAPIPTVPAAIGRGCYWRRCTFCPDHLHAVHEPCSHQGLETFLHAVADRFPLGAMLHLTDSALPTQHLEHLAHVIARDRLPISWHGFIRAEPAFARPEFARHLAQGGCAMLQLGVETGSPRLLRVMGKGVGPELTQRVLQATAAAGIRNHVYLLFGLPTETDLDREMTLAFVEAQASSIAAINPALLNLPKGSPMHRHAEKFGVTELVPFGHDTDLSLYDDFRCDAIHPRREARRWLAHRFFKHPAVRTIQRGLRDSFKANHLCFLGG